MSLRRRLILGLGAALLAAEAALRWGVGLGQPPLAMLDPETEYQLVADRSYSRWGNRISVNRHGWRAPDHPEHPATDERRVLLIGDSVVYGNHFLDQSETIAYRLSDALSQPGCRVLALPVAVSSWGPVNQAAAVARSGTFGASAAGVVVSFHDLFDVPGPEPSLVPYRLTPPYSAVVDAIIGVYERVFRPEPAPERRTPEARASASLDALDRLSEQLAADDVATWLIYHPTPAERAGSPHPARARFFDWAQQRGVPVLDLGSAAPDLLAERDYRDSIHPSASGAARIAQVLSETFKPALGCP